PVAGRRIGIHTSIAGALSNAVERAYRLGCNTFQIFSSSPRQWKQSRVDLVEARRFAQLREKYDLYPLVIHDNYLINLASWDPVIRSKSVEAFRAELERAVALGAEYLVTHPGSATNGDRKQALVNFITGLEEAGRGRMWGRLRVLIENTAGGGGALGSDFEELRAILELAQGAPLGCCIDTAHCYQAGFDVSTAKGLEDMLARLDKAVGLARVYVVHTNDSRTALGSHADRHEHIGKGGIGLEGFRRILNHPGLRDKAFILETPIENDGDDLRNLETVRRLVKDNTKTRRHKVH
ncbi:MAG: deoxyribonuclease IV, partial [bacterium]